MCAGWGGVGLGRVGVTCAQNRISLLFFWHLEGKMGRVWTLCVSHGVAADWEQMPDPRPARAPQMAMGPSRAQPATARGGRAEELGCRCQGAWPPAPLWPLADMTSYDELLLRVSRTLTHNRMEVEYEYYVVVVYLHPSSLFAKGKKGYSLEKA